MPEMTFTVRWPDGSVEDCYSPSLVMHDYLDVGARYTVAEFTRRSTAALAEASERVRARYGLACTSAAETTQRIRSRAARLDPGAAVEVLRLHPPLPDPQEQV